MVERLVDWVWRGPGAAAAVARALLSPLGAAYLAVADFRNSLFRRGVLRAAKAPIPVLSIGNLTVGGTGKTPISAWFVAQLRKRGASPAVVMRGVGGDEVVVHQLLSPGTPVIVSPSRAEGVERASRDAKATVAVLDDAFQHRWIARDADVVLFAAEDALGSRRGLPAGPWRERLESVRRASLSIVTRKSASPELRDEVMALLARTAPGVAAAAVHLAGDQLVRCGSTLGEQSAERRPLSTLASKSVLVIAAIGNPRAFVEQISGLGARVTDALFADQHHYSGDDVAELASRARTADLAVCTLKDAVKLASLWPGDAPPLWYVSQQVIIERGADAIDAMLDTLLKAPTQTSR